MHVTVIVCTRDRARQLAELLNSMCNLEKPEASWDLLVVDNGSSDATAATIDSFIGRLPIRRLFEPVPGVSNARNTGVAAATGKYIVWTDDDIHVDSGWLRAYVDAFVRWPDAAIFGGKVTPILTPPTPDWYRRGTRDLANLLCVRDFGDEPAPLSVLEDRLPFGANMAVRTIEQRQFAFDPNLGVEPTRRMGGEEIDIARRILNAGWPGWWIPEARVDHIIPLWRQTADYIIYYHEAIGQYDIQNDVINGNRARQLLTIAYLAITLPISWLKYLLACALDLDQRALFLRNFAYKRGVLKSFSRRRRL